MENLRITNAGIPVLDSLLGGGYLSNSIIVISHQPGVKLLEFNHHLLFNNFSDKTHLIVVTFHLSLQANIERLKFSMQKSEFLKKVAEIFSSDRISIIDCFNIPNDEENSKKGNIRHVSNPFNLEDLLSVMTQVRESIPEDRQARWFFYNLTEMSVGVPEDELVKFCRRAFRYHKQKGDLAIYSLNENAHSNTFFAKIYQLSDVFIKLTAEETSWGLTNGFQVIKGVFPFQSKKVFYDIDENGELQFITDKSRSKPETPTINIFSTSSPLESEKVGWKDSKFIRTGLPELDSLLGGGMLSDSIIIFSNQYGVRILEPIIHILQNQFGEKTHVIPIDYHFSLHEYETRLKVYEQKAEIYKGPARSLLFDKLSLIDCFGTSNETDTHRNNFYSVSNPFDVNKLLSVMTNVRNSIPEDKSVIWIFNSLTDMSIGIPEDEVLKFCRRAFRYHKRCGDLVAYTMNEQAHSEIFRAKIYQLADVYIKFIWEDTAKGIDTSIQILKGTFNFNSKKTKYLLDEKCQMQFMDD